MIWILLSVVLLLNPRTRKSGAILAVAALMLAGEKKRPKGIPECQRKMAIERKLWIPALVLAVFIAFSRLYLYVHSSRQCL